MAGIKNDEWIKHMARKHKMIEPFAEKLVRKGKISYGLSSYGYDMRVADEFYIFHNAYPTEIIDPKNFKENYFIKHRGKFCIVPPNSFALARSVEYFRIPRNVLAIVLGKSSYARCGIIVNVTPLEPCYDKETEVLTIDGWKKFYELSQDDLLATLNSKGELEYQRQIKFQKFRYKGKMIRIRGRNIDLCVTPDHLLLVRKRWRKYFEFVKAKDVYGKYNYELKRDAKWRGEEREYFYLPRILDENRLNKFKNLTSILETLKQNNLTTVGIKNNLNKVPHRTLLFYLDELYSKGFLEKSVIFKRRKIGANRIFVWGLKKNLNELHDFYLKPIKIKMKDWLKFFGIWLAEGSAYIDERKRNYTVKIACFDPKKRKIIRKWLSKLPFKFFETKEGFICLNKSLCLYLKQFGHAPEKFIPKEIKNLASSYLKILLSSFLLGDGNLQTLTYTTTSKKLADDLQEIILKCGWTAIVRKIPKTSYKRRILKGHLVQANYDIYKIRINKRHLTPKIYKNSFSLIDYNDYVYDVTVPNHTLYVRRNGKACWSSNCWEGYVTIEISNTTPLPAKIYANEGIAQVIFLEADEPCKISYADRKGKYQNQKGITLPKVDK
jgi:deoxycytidine triphosphate deaminase